MVPVPFGKLHVTIGEPIYANRRDDDQLLAQTIGAALHRTRTRAQVMAGIRPFVACSILRIQPQRPVA